MPLSLALAGLSVALSQIGLPLQVRKFVPGVVIRRHAEPGLLFGCVAMFRSRVASEKFFPNSILLLWHVRDSLIENICLKLVKVLEARCQLVLRMRNWLAD
jgi:hypothetical protein